MSGSGINQEQAIAILRDVLRFDAQGRVGVALTPETRLEDIAVDSLQMSELILDLEDRLGVELDDDVLLKLSSSETIGDFLDGFVKTAGDAIGSSELRA